MEQRHISDLIGLKDTHYFGGLVLPSLLLITCFKDKLNFRSISLYHLTEQHRLLSIAT
ncbi:hypothetical protein [Candidatus Protochlamydia sp. W-9]|uniref:hypothetical protein n=1 Tax=Candidatus Protochlamydia sp. W-9 TaxID=1785087 RepID=UPI001D044661|nr:hypothetical protein [Candidatus Protochlamydia sp. W-9]